MRKNRTVIELITSFAIGSIFGSLFTILYLSLSNPHPPVTITGQIVFDSGSYIDEYLAKHPIYLDDSAVIQGPTYLDFANDKMLNDVITIRDGKNVSMSGHLTAVQLDNGTYVPELTVRNMKLLDP